jgi:hypothetical protein
MSTGTRHDVRLSGAAAWRGGIGLSHSRSSRTPLAAEWLRLFRIAPFAAAGPLAVRVAAIATAPPLIWLARAVM